MEISRRNTMKGFIILLAFVAAATFVAGAALSEERLAPVIWEGVFIVMDGNKLIMSVKEPEGKEKDVTVLTTDRTTVTLDGKDAHLGDLKTNYLLRVTLVPRKLGEAATADIVGAKTPPPVAK
jgi:hypothetical protein